MAEQKRQQQSQPPLELLAVELQLEVLERIGCYRDLRSLIMASRPYHATFLRYKKSVLAHVAQAMLGDSFIDACMLQLWEGHLNRHPGENSLRRGRDPRQWPPGPYRHVQLKFKHDCDRYRGYVRAGMGPGGQIRHMQDLLTAEDFYRVLSYNQDGGPGRLLWALGPIRTQPLTASEMTRMMVALASAPIPNLRKNGIGWDTQVWGHLSDAWK